MKITRKEKDESKSFYRLVPGALFIDTEDESNDYIYLRIETIEDKTTKEKYNAVFLCDGELTSFDDDAKIIEIKDAELIVEI